MSRRPIQFTFGMAIGAALAVLLAAIGCTPEQQALWDSLTPEQQSAVLADAAAKAAPTDCYGALHHFPGDRATARQIIHRESRNNPAAANTSSTARGCWQLLMSLHSWRFTAVGCSPSEWSDPVCNTKAAAHLYNAAGWSPWRY